MKSIAHILLFFLSFLAAVSCYKDKGNYEYTEINEVEITTETYSYTVGSETVLELRPTVAETMTEGTSNLSYTWWEVVGTSWNEVGDGPTYSLEITPSDDQVFNFVFAVTDNNLGTTTYAEIAVNPVSDFDQCWLILQDKGGKAVLGSVNGEGPAGDRGIAQELSYVSLDGAPLFLGVHPFFNPYSPTTPEYMQGNHTPLVGVFTTSNQYILDGFTLQPHPNLTYNRIVYGKKYAGRENMPVGNGDGPVSMKGQKNGFAIIDGGSVWFAVPDQYALMYPAKVSSSSADMFDYEAADVCLSYSVNYSFLMYDSKYNRFLFYNSDDFGNGFDDRGQIAESGGEYDDLYLNGTRNNQQTMSEIGNDIAYPNAFDPSDIPAGFVIDDMEVSTGNGHLDNVLAVGHVGSTFHVYEFCMAEIAGKPMDDNPSPNCSAAWEVPVVGNVSGAGKIPVTTSSAFVRQFYYAAGNTLYRVDLTSSSPVPAAIWSAEDETAVITGLKFKSDNEDISYDEDGVLGLMKGITSDLGAIVRHSDGSCELVEFQMTTGGEIEKDDNGEQNIQIFEGFENVVDFIFSFRSYIR